MHHLFPLHTNQQLHVLVDVPLQKTRTKHHVIAIHDNVLKHNDLNVDDLAHIREHHLHLIKIILRDLTHLIVHKRHKKHHLINPISEFQQEAPFELTHHFTLN